jgi:hypothetical protein
MWIRKVHSHASSIPNTPLERKRQPFKALQELLAESGYQVLDAGNISIERVGHSIWVQEPGHEYHSNILNRMAL